MASIMEIKCEDIQSIEDFHKKLAKWNDYHGGGKGDSSKVSCKQVGKNYDELMDKFTKHYEKNYTEKQVVQAMCRCCKEKLLTKKPDKFAKLFLSEAYDEWDAFYECMDTQNIYRHGKKPVKLNLF